MTKGMTLKIGPLFFALITPLSFGLESTQTLPKGVSRVRNVDIFSRSVGDKYDSNGKLRGVADPLNKSITAGQIIEAGLKSDPKNEDYVSLKALYEGLNNLDPNQNLGEFFQVDLTGDAAIQARRHYLSYEYGISNDLSFGISIPLIHYDVSANVSANMVSNSAALKNLNLVQAAKIGPKLDTVAAKSADIEEAVLNAAFDDKGYQRPHDFSYSAFGELEIGAKKSWLRKEHHGFSTQVNLRLPTASKKKDYTNIFDPGVGDNQTDLYTLFVYDYMPTSNWRLGTSAKYTFQIPDTEYMPVRRNGESGLADLNDPYVWDNVGRNLGDSLDYEVIAAYSFYKKRFNATAIYNFHTKASDSIRGSKDLDYASISEGTSKSFHGYEFGIQYSTVNDVLTKGSGVPFEVRVAYNDTIAGKNTYDASFYRLDLHLYFK
ncbi:hypothetical protein GW915_05345 [bacterium]|nr:hypothetical protein [bacterium]